MPASAVRVLRGIADAEQTDAELLGRFIDRRDEAAFALLVRRHGAMVYGVCRRVLPDHDAEDAFQATFLVLAEKARTVVPREAVGNWLYGVARRAALLSRRSIARRREQTGDVPERPATQSAELRAMLDEELSRLPDAYRVVIVLCDLEGRTRREAAVMLGWPEGTVAGRLVRARKLLAKRLAPSVSIAAVLAGTASARVPAVLPSTATIPSGVAALTREVLGTMTRGKLMKAAVAVLLLGCAGFGMVLQAGQPPATKDAPAPPAAPMNPPKADDVAWGQEVDGLQLGLAGVAGEYRPGETMQARVRLRNVGKVEVKITHGLLKEYAPIVTDAKGARMTVAMPASPRYYVPPKDRVIKPGETVGLFDPVVAVEPEDRAGLDGLLRVQTPTTYLAPGKYRIAFGGMIQSHPKLSTAKVEFEVKDRVAWGKEVNGLQAGLEVKERPPYLHGATLTLTVRIRNVGKEAVKFEYIRQYLDENAPAVTGADGKPITQDKVGVTGVAHVPVEVSLEPGKEVVLETRIHGASGRPYELRPGRPGTTATRNHPLYVGTGKVALQYEKVFGNSSIGRIKIDPDLAGLATGKLELEVEAAPPAVTIKDVTLTDVDEGAGTISVSFGSKDSPTKLVNVPLAAGVRLVASHVLPGSVNNLPFEWENLKRLKGKVVSIGVSTSARGMSVVSIASGND